MIPLWHAIPFITEADPVVDLIAAGGARFLVHPVVQLQPGVPGEVAGSDEEPREIVCNGVEASVDRLASGDLVTGLEHRQLLLPVVEPAAGHARVPDRTVSTPRVEAFRPLGVHIRTAHDRFPVVREHLLRYVECLVRRESEDLLRLFHLVRAERITVGRGRVGLVRRRPADVAAENDQRRLVLDVHRCSYRTLESDRVVRDLAHVLRVPTVGLEASDRIVGECELGRTVDRDVVVVIYVDEPAQAEMAGQ
jgi:hypothetical protein